MRTTVDIDASVLTQLRERQRREGKTLGRIVSELLARALHEPVDGEPVAMQWTSQDMAARVDLEDRDAVADLLDEPL